MTSKDDPNTARHPSGSKADELIAHDKATGMELVTLEEAANRYPVSYKRLRAAVRANELPIIKPSRTWLVRVDALEAWLASQEHYYSEPKKGKAQ